ncbi:MAG: hypothetical protein IKW83_00415 [Muribaculaceae bacterium]|nr:hypothetical protein [Muribaculaceae bacterium]
METDNNMTELEQMREQMNVFKSHLDEQPIINEQLVRNSMGGKMSWIKKFVWGEIALIPFLLAVMASFHVSMGLSWWLFAFLAVGLIADVIGDYIINRIPKSQLLSGDLVETSQHLAKMKKQRTQWFIIGLIFILIWFVWFCAELILSSKLASGKETLSYFVIGAAVVGGIIGLIIAWLIFRKMQKTNNQIIEQINQISKED